LAGRTIKNLNCQSCLIVLWGSQVCPSIFFESRDTVINCRSSGFKTEGSGYYRVKGWPTQKLCPSNGETASVPDVFRRVVACWVLLLFPAEGRQIRAAKPLCIHHSSNSGSFGVSISDAIPRQLEITRTRRNYASDEYRSNRVPMPTSVSRV
jgi:hypothetical protein